MAGTLTPAWFLYFTDDEGAPLVGGKIYTYITGTSTPTPLYHDALLASPWTNPIVIPADGVVVAYQDANTIKAVIFDADGNLIRTIDPIASTALSGGGGSGGVALFLGGNDSFPIIVTSLPTGTAVSAIHPGTSLFVIDSADLIGDYGLQAMMQSGAADTVTASFVNLSDGSPDVPLVSISSSSTTGERQVSGAITFGASGTARTYAVKTKSGAGAPGYAYGFALVRV